MPHGLLPFFLTLEFDENLIFGHNSNSIYFMRFSAIQFLKSFDVYLVEKYYISYPESNI